MSDNFTFSQLNFNGDENQRRRQRAGAATTTNNTNIAVRLPQTYTNAFFDRLFGENSRALTVSLFASLEVQRSPQFRSNKYVSTPLGYINRDFFSKQTPARIQSPHYIPSFSNRLIMAAAQVIPESRPVLNFVLDTIKQLPCNVPIRWGTLFNSKFRRVFECLTLETWTALCEVLKTHGYAKLISRYIHLIDPNLVVSSIDQISIQLNQQDATNTPRTPPARPTLSFPNPIISPTRVAPLIPVLPQTTTPITRTKNISIYALQVSNSVSPALADRFSCGPRLNGLIRSIYYHIDSHYIPVIKQLEDLPVTIPLRWGVIFNKCLRVRAQSVNSRNRQTALEQWKKVKVLLIAEGYLDDKSVPNCAILINKE